MDKTKNQLQISVSNGSFVDKGDGEISFPQGLTITDDSVMRSGTRYDIGTLDISNYAGQLTGDHVDSLGTLIGKTIGVVKEGNRIAIQGIKYAVKQNPYARLAYDLLVGGFSNSFSIETIGPWPNEQDNTYYAHELVGLSQVVVPNNYNATINQFNEIVHNSLERSQQDGLDITGVEAKILSKVTFVKSEAVKEESMTKEEKEKLAVEEAAKIEAENAVAEKAKQDAAEEVAAQAAEEAKVKAEADAKAEEEAKAEAEAKAEVEAQAEADAKQAAEKVAEEEAKVAQDAAEAKEKEEAEAKAQAEADAEQELNKNKENLEMTKEEIAEIVASSVAAALKPVQDELTAAKELAQNALDAQAKEPAFKKEEVIVNSYDGMSEEQLFSKQLNAAVAAERMQSIEGRTTLNEINARNLQALKDAKILSAAVSLEDLGNFVIGPELYNQVATARTDFSVLVDATNWKETQSIEFGWLTRSSDIDMQSVALGVFGDAPGANDRLKPVSTPAYGAHTDKLEEMAAVTPISINVIKFAAADILADVAEGYRTDYDRKRAQLVVARLQQAVNQTGNKFVFDMSEGLVGWAAVTSLISDATTVGTLIFNNKTLTALKGMALTNYNGSILAEISNGTILGTPFIVVPNSLLPTLNTTETKTFKVYGANVTIDQAVFYGDLRTFTGRSSGGLKYDVDGSASYEIGGVVYSAYQRNEIVLRGAFFRGGVVKDTSVVASIPANAVS